MLVKNNIIVYMPYKIIHHHDGSFAVYNIDKKEYKAKHTTLDNAKKQIRLLEYVDAKKHNKIK